MPGMRMSETTTAYGGSCSSISSAAAPPSASSTSKSLRSVRVSASSTYCSSSTQSTRGVDGARQFVGEADREREQPDVVQHARDACVGHLSRQLGGDLRRADAVGSNLGVGRGVDASVILEGMEDISQSNEVTNHAEPE